ncbi:hypothetical protein PPERSA_00313 [Pseudocohnilembus persalinus]|uniref:Uncharacterized protein n=1 Tax=Pseudocohnilembus persalinus TaxID=266149 RepID=A0A0V0QHG7_PSEPJ|nr:hypothetical protein PPERSA_00313 [Pseudocohnilembus persalinus]|eukprot:KRX01606.1 hypothetical protein PPERSA_00313 [Pseudocohnilembus persalinus]
MLFPREKYEFQAKHKGEEFLNYKQKYLNQYHCLNEKLGINNRSQEFIDFHMAEYGTPIYFKQNENSQFENQQKLIQKQKNEKKFEKMNFSQDQVQNDKKLVKNLKKLRSFSQDLYSENNNKVFSNEQNKNKKQQQNQNKVFYQIQNNQNDFNKKSSNIIQNQNILITQNENEVVENFIKQKQKGDLKQLSPQKRQINQQYLNSIQQEIDLADQRLNTQEKKSQKKLEQILEKNATLQKVLKDKARKKYNEQKFKNLKKIQILQYFYDNNSVEVSDQLEDWKFYYKKQEKQSQNMITQKNFKNNNSVYEKQEQTSRPKKNLNNLKHSLQKLKNQHYIQQQQIQLQQLKNNINIKNKNNDNEFQIQQNQGNSVSFNNNINNNINFNTNTFPSLDMSLLNSNQSDINLSKIQDNQKSYRKCNNSQYLQNQIKSLDLDLYPNFSQEKYDNSIQILDQQNFQGCVDSVFDSKDYQNCSEFNNLNQNSKQNKELNVFNVNNNSMKNQCKKLSAHQISTSPNCSSNKSNKELNYGFLFPSVYTEKSLSTNKKIKNQSKVFDSNVLNEINELDYNNVNLSMENKTTKPESNRVELYQSYKNKKQGQKQVKKDRNQQANQPKNQDKLQKNSAQKCQDSSFQEYLQNIIEQNGIKFKNDDKNYINNIYDNSNKKINTRTNSLQIDSYQYQQQKQIQNKNTKNKLKLGILTDMLLPIQDQIQMPPEFQIQDNKLQNLPYIQTQQQQNEKISKNFISTKTYKKQFIQKKRNEFKSYDNRNQNQLQSQQKYKQQQSCSLQRNQEKQFYHQKRFYNEDLYNPNERIIKKFSQQPEIGEKMFQKYQQIQDQKFKEKEEFKALPVNQKIKQLKSLNNKYRSISYIIEKY